VEQSELTRDYKGFTICGGATPVHNDIGRSFAVGSVLLVRTDNRVLQVDRFYDPLLVYEDEDQARWFGIFLAELAVDHCVPPPAYYLRPMDFAWAVDILRRAAAECTEREIRRPKLYEALDFLEGALDRKWLVRRYRRALIGDRRNWREKEELRETLRVAARGIQYACAALLVARMNKLARGFRENKAEIDNLRWQLSIVRKP